MPDDQNPPGGISTRLVSFSADSADQPGVNDYDSFAEAYAASNENNLVNAHYERPAMLALAGDVAGRRILDAGCGSGPLFAALRDRGAIVTGFDKSAGMVELARRRLSGDGDLLVAELGSPLPFPDGTFDDVTASLVLHYLKDWGPALAELRRVLKPGGRLIVSVNHPFAENLWHREAGLEPDYFATYNYVVEWTVDGQTALLRFWTRPLRAMTDAFTKASFRISVISEPPPAPGGSEPAGGTRRRTASAGQLARQVGGFRRACVAGGTPARRAASRGQPRDPAPRGTRRHDPAARLPAAYGRAVSRAGHPVAGPRSQ